MWWQDQTEIGTGIIIHSLLNTFIRQKAEQTDVQEGRQTNKQTDKQTRRQSYEIKEMTKK